MENKKISFTLPMFSISALYRDLLNSYTNLKQKLKNFSILFFETRNTIADGTRRSFSNPMNVFNRGFKRNRKKVLMSIIPVVLVLVLAGSIFYALRPTAQGSVQGSASGNVQVADAKENQTLNKLFTYPLLDGEGEEVGSFSYEVQSAEMRDEIIVKGQRATAVSGRIFLIVNLKLKNDLTQGLEINSRDYIRLSVNGNKDDLLAPEIHNDPVEVQAISSKFTRLGFAINSDDRNPVLIIGEIDGEKQEIPLKF